MGRGLHPGFHVAAFGLHLPGLLGVDGARGHGQARHRADGGQRLAPEAQAHHPLQVLEVADLAGGVAGQCQRQVVRRDAAAVVTHPQQLDAALFHLDVDAPGAGVQAVLQQFLDDRGGALDHLTGGDLVRQPRAQQLDARQLAHGWAARFAAGIFRVWPTLMLSFFSALALRRVAMLTS
ncbi:hypothetical protein D9M70_498920 [compost metagenome]